MEDKSVWENLSPDEKKKELFLRQKRMLDLFSQHMSLRFPIEIILMADGFRPLPM